MNTSTSFLDALLIHSSCLCHLIHSIDIFYLFPIDLKNGHDEDENEENDEDFSEEEVKKEKSPGKVEFLNYLYCLYDK